MSPEAALLVALLFREAPLEAKSTRRARWERDIPEAVELDRKVASAGALVSPEVDAAVLDAMRWYEARLQPHPKDGDCHPQADKTAPSGFRIVCHAFGPLEVNLGAYRAVLGTPEAALVGLEVSRKDAKVTDLRDPETGVRVGYAGLLRWKQLCGGTPARWITAWGWGKCPPPRVVDGEAVRRCELATILLQSRGQAEGWRCGHEGRQIRNDHDRNLLKWARRRVQAESAHADGLHHDP